MHTCLYTAVLLCFAAGFMYGNIYDDEERFERQAVFPKLLAQHAEDFSWVSSKSIAYVPHVVMFPSLPSLLPFPSFSLLPLLQSKTSFNRDAVKAGTGRR